MTEVDFSMKDLDSSDDVCKQQLKNLAMIVFRKDEKELTKTDILLLLQMEMATLPTKLTVLVGENRRTTLQFCQWKGDMQMELDLQGLRVIAENILGASENPIEGFVKASGYIKGFILSKLERTENMLREQMHESMKKDGLEQIPTSRFER